MTRRVSARVAQDEREERQVRKLAGSHHAPADWKFHAKTGGRELGRQDASRHCPDIGLPPSDGTHPPEPLQCARDQRFSP